MDSVVRTRKRAGRLQSAGVIREAATALFLQNGYLGTSMDQVATQAGVSKQTVYTHFADKERLFVDLVTGAAERAGQFIENAAGTLRDSVDVKADLEQVARRYLRTVMQPQVLQARRLVIGESARFPELARTYYARAPERTLETLAAGFQALTERGLLQVDDALQAASHFAALVLWIPLDRAMFLSDVEGPSEAELDTIADAGVRVFLAAYGR